MTTHARRATHIIGVSALPRPSSQRTALSLRRICRFPGRRHGTGLAASLRFSRLRGAFVLPRLPASRSGTLLGRPSRCWTSSFRAAYGVDPLSPTDSEDPARWCATRKKPERLARRGTRRSAWILPSRTRTCGIRSIDTLAARILCRL